MCVILVATKNKPTRALLEDCANANRDGGGVAWREGKLVHWIKARDLGPKDIAAIIEKIPAFPFVVHFRISTVGGINHELCHPFPVTEKAEHTQSGSAKAVLFHNGTWSPWQEHMIQSVTKAGIEVPGGPWSDSRAMAFLAHQHGAPFVSLIPDSQRVVYLGSKRIIVHGKGWHSINAGLQASNTHWMRRSYLRTAASRIGVSSGSSLIEHRTPTKGTRTIEFDEAAYREVDTFDDVDGSRPLWETDGRGGLKHASRKK